MLLAWGSDVAQQLETVRVIHRNQVLLFIDNIEKPVLVIDRQSHRIHQPLGDLPLDLMFGVEDKNPMHLAVGDKQPVAVVDGEAVDESKCASIPFLISWVPCFSVEDKDRSDFLSAT